MNDLEKSFDAQKSSDHATAAGLISSEVENLKSTNLISVEKWFLETKEQNQEDQNNNLHEAAFYALDSWESTREKMKVDIACKLKAYFIKKNLIIFI